MKIKRVSVEIEYVDGGEPTRVEYDAGRYDLTVDGASSRQFARGWRSWLDAGEHMPTGMSTFRLSVVAKDREQCRIYREWAATRRDVEVEPLERPAVAIVSNRLNERCPLCGYPDTHDGQHFKGIYDSTQPCPHCHDQP